MIPITFYNFIDGIPFGADVASIFGECRELPGIDAGAAGLARTGLCSSEVRPTNCYLCLAPASLKGQGGGGSGGRKQQYGLFGVSRPVPSVRGVRCWIMYYRSLSLSSVGVESSVQFPRY